jgi:lipopolysaccharide transport system ATP-binding protein
MGDIAIRVENLGKKYKIGANQTRYQTLRESIVSGFSNSFERIKGAQPKEENIIWALKDINFEVKHGEVLGIIGRNGAGKSTLLKILSRITRPTTGRFELNGRVGSLLEVGTGFHPELTGRDNIYLSGAILGMQRKEINRKFDEIVDFAEIEKFLDTPAKHYSSGMYMRLAFSVAAHLEPEILLVDEVLAVGDAEFQKKCMGKMGDVAGDGRTVLFVSHNMAAINALCNHGLLLNSGTMDYLGEIDQCVNQYLHLDKLISDLPVINFKEEVKRSIQFFSISITNSNKEIKKIYSYKEPIWIRIEFLVHYPISGVYFAAHIHDGTLNTLLFTRDFDSTEINLRILEQGHYTYSFYIPAPLLVPGFYNISIHIAHSNPPELIEGVDHVCSFEIFDDGSENAKKGFPWRGKLSIPIKWDLKKNE